MKRSALVLALLALAAAPAAADTIPQGGGANNVVIVQSTADQAWQERSHVEVATVGGNTVASANLADAEATDCTGCRASAVAVQVLFVTGQPSVFTPANAAVAVNSGCTGCGTFAYAWQDVLQTSGPVFLSATGRLELQQLRQQIADTVASIDPTSLAADQELRSELDALTAQLQTVVSDEVQMAGVHATGSPVEQVHLGD